MKRQWHRRNVWLALAAMLLQLLAPLSSYAMAHVEPGFGDICSSAAYASRDRAPAVDTGRAASGVPEFPAGHSNQHAPSHCAHCTTGAGGAAMLSFAPALAERAAVFVPPLTGDILGPTSAHSLLPPARGPPPSFL